jgi:retron-type reverse transcriptase
VASLEDKIVQQAVLWVLQSIYEQDFLGFSYGFRLGRGCHDALDALSVGLTSKRVNWVLDADIEGFFDGMAARVSAGGRCMRINLWLSYAVR